MNKCSVIGKREIEGLMFNCLELCWSAWAWIYEIAQEINYADPSFHFIKFYYK